MASNLVRQYPLLRKMIPLSKLINKQKIRKHYLSRNSIKIKHQSTILRNNKDIPLTLGSSPSISSNSRMYKGRKISKIRLSQKGLVKSRIAKRLSHSTNKKLILRKIKKSSKI